MTSTRHADGPSPRIGRRAIAIVLLLFAGCSGRPARVGPPSIDPDHAGQQALAEYDRDADDQLSKDELAGCPGILGRIAEFDQDNDDHVSADEIAERIGTWQTTQVGLMSLRCRVTLNGQPLAGAEVKLIPEKFLGPAVQPAAGTTDTYGEVYPAIAEDQLPTDLQGVKGVHLGIYKVKITHPTRKLPDSDLGTEVVHRDQWNGIHLELKRR